jgi:hypothetical protein
MVGFDIWKSLVTPIETDKLLHELRIYHVYLFIQMAGACTLATYYTVHATNLLNVKKTTSCQERSKREGEENLSLENQFIFTAHLPARAAQLRGDYMYLEGLRTHSTLTAGPPTH